MMFDFRGLVIQKETLFLEIDIIGWVSNHEDVVADLVCLDFPGNLCLDLFCTALEPINL